MPKYGKASYLLLQKQGIYGTLAILQTCIDAEYGILKQNSGA